MSMLTMYILGAAMIAATLGMFWYFIRSVSVMGGRNILAGIAGVVLVPIAQLIFYVVKDDDLDDKERKAFIGLGVSILVIAIISAISAIYPPPPM